MDVTAKAERVKLILFDVDGVLTDGTVVVHGDGTESKTFAIRDGIAIIWAARAGLRIGFLSARMSQATRYRAAQLGVSIVHQGVASKTDTYATILSTEQVTREEVAYMGDDIVDLGVLRRVGLSAAPADAVAEVRAGVDWISTAAGGRGAARELIELVLRAQNLWEPIVARYASEGDRRASDAADVTPPLR